MSNFIGRDATYFVGGGVVVLSFLHAIGVQPWAVSPNILGSVFLFVLLCGVSYFVGFACQELFAVLGLAIVADSWNKPDRLTEIFYSRIARGQWSDAKPSKNDPGRIINFKHVGSCGGACAIVSGTILVANAAVALGFAGLGTGVLLLFFGRVKALQQANLDA